MARTGAVLIWALLASLLVMGAAAVPGGLHSWKGRVSVLGVAALVVVGFVYLPGDVLVERFGKLATGEMSADTRAQVWRESRRLIAAYPLFGCGRGDTSRALRGTRRWRR